MCPDIHHALMPAAIHHLVITQLPEQINLSTSLNMLYLRKSVEHLSSDSLLLFILLNDTQRLDGPSHTQTEVKTQALNLPNV